MIDKGDTTTTAVVVSSKEAAPLDGIFFEDDSGSVILKSDRNLLIDGSEGGAFDQIFEDASIHQEEDERCSQQLLNPFKPVSMVEKKAGQTNYYSKDQQLHTWKRNVPTMSTTTTSSTPICLVCSSDSSDSSPSPTTTSSGTSYKVRHFSSIIEECRRRHHTVDTFYSEPTDYSTTMLDGSFVHHQQRIHWGSESSDDDDDDVYIENETCCSKDTLQEFLVIAPPPPIIELQNNLDESCSSFFDEEMVEM
jgi:hypothetical protein